MDYGPAAYSILIGADLAAYGDLIRADTLGLIGFVGHTGGDTLGLVLFMVI